MKLLQRVIGPIATGVWLIAELPGVLDGHPVTESVEWVPALGMNLDLRLDRALLNSGDSALHAL